MAMLSALVEVTENQLSLMKYVAYLGYTLSAVCLMLGLFCVSMIYNEYNIPTLKRRKNVVVALIIAFVILLALFGYILYTAITMSFQISDSVQV